MPTARTAISSFVTGIGPSDGSKPKLRQFITAACTGMSRRPTAIGLAILTQARVVMTIERAGRRNGKAGWGHKAAQPGQAQAVGTRKPEAAELDRCRLNGRQGSRQRAMTARDVTRLDVERDDLPANGQTVVAWIKGLDVSGGLFHELRCFT